MVLGLSTSIRVPTPVPSMDYTAKVTERLLEALKEQVPNIAIQSSQPIKYTRPYFQNGRINIASFTSGEVTVSRDNSDVLVRYSLGVLSFVEQVVMMVPAYFLFVWNGMPPKYAQGIVVLAELGIMARILYTWRSVRSWFTSIVISAVNEQ